MVGWASTKKLERKETDMTALSTIEFALPAAGKLPESLQLYRQKSKTGLTEIASPTRKTESWKYSAKRLGLQESYACVTPPSADYQPVYALDCDTLILANGRLQSHDLNISGLTIKAFADLSDAEAQRVQSGLVAQSNDLQFATLNAACLQDGVYLSVDANTHIAKPLKLVIQHTGEGMSFPRIFLQLGKGASICLIEELNLIADDQPAFSNGVCDIVVEENAKLQYLRMNLDQSSSQFTASQQPNCKHPNCKHIGATGVQLMRNARFESYCLALGSALGRHDLRVKMLEPGAECSLNGVCVTRNKQHYDNHTCIEHVAPHCTSHENYRCIADDQSQIVFNGRIHIHRDAQKSAGSMSNNNLLLSSKAEIDSKPELEIYADDVKCAHGTTIGRLNKHEVYYLKTRGLSEEQARLMLTLGFVLEIVRAVPLDEVAEFWEQTLSKALLTQSELSLESSDDE